MPLRPRPARWFELLTPREELTRALDCLAASKAVELEAHSSTRAPMSLPDLHEGLTEFDELRRRYAHVWPPPSTDEPPGSRDPEVMLGRALRGIKAWAEGAGPLIETQRNLARDRGDLDLLADFLGAADRLPAIDRLAAAGPVLGARLFLLPPQMPEPAVPTGVLQCRAQSAMRSFVLGVGPAEEVEAYGATLQALRARPIHIPPWLSGTRNQALKRIAAERERLEADQRKTAAKLAALGDAHRLPEHLRDIAVLEWLTQNVPTLPLTEHFAWVTGWTSDPDGAALETVLAQGDVPHLLYFPDELPDSRIPTVLSNPVWARQFEIFARLLGVPGATEVDPSSIVAVAAPVMFGYMFGDIVHGLVLLIAGLALRERLPALALLVPGGIMSMLFGWVFGSIYALETIIPPLWLHPLEHPVPVLVVSLVFGAALLTLGLLLDALQTHWGGQARRWWMQRAGLLACYLGIIAAVLDPRSLWLALAGALWFTLGAAAGTSTRRALGFAAAWGKLFESLMQLLVNTVSFVRVGAFALAHAGLSAAMVGVAEAAGGVGFWVLLTLGNVIIIVLEGLVVGIQTTRLVLFEFFVRFMKGEGRVFSPLPARPGRGVATRGESHDT
jgi:V/A-type H+-transporting ATPase subunit I